MLITGFTPTPQSKSDGSLLISSEQLFFAFIQPVGQMNSQAPQPIQMGDLWSKGGITFRLVPRSANPMIEAPIFSLHIRTQSPHRMQSSFFFGNLLSLTPNSNAASLISIDSGQRANKSSIIIFRVFITISVSVETNNPSIQGYRQDA